MSAFALNTTVGIYLFIAVFKIRSFLLREDIKQERINVKIMVLHTSTFGLFLLAIFGFTCIEFNFETKGRNMATASPIYFISLAIVCVISFTS